jgi:long-chain fatty acid transport protein
MKNFKRGGSMKKFSKVLLVSTLTLIFSISLFSNGLNLNSIGSRASSMGTAFIGLADDFSAVFFNPAGLTQMKKANLTIFGTSLIPTGTYQYELAGIDTQTESKMYPSGALAYFNPVSDKLVLGLAVYAPSGTGGAWNGEDLAVLTGGTVFEWESKIFAVTISPVIAYQITDNFSVGATLNISYGMLTTKSPGIGQYSEDLSGISFGATLGVLFAPSDFISIGASLRTASKINFEGDAVMEGFAMYGLETTATASRDTTWPMVAGIGVAIKPIDKLTIVADAVWTNWAKLDTIPVEYDDATWQPTLDGVGVDYDYDLRWEDTWQLKIGLEYQVSECLALRAGYYSDPAPSPLITQNILLPNIDYNIITVGIGYKKNKIAIDFGFEYLMGTDRYVDPLDPANIDAMPGTHGLSMLVPNLTFTYYFGGK